MFSILGIGAVFAAAKNYVVGLGKNALVAAKSYVVVQVK